MAGQQEEPAGLRLRLVNLGREIPVRPGRPLLEAALAAGLNLPHGCRGGNCGACAARLLRGDCHYPDGEPLGLSAHQQQEGWILLCRAHARSDLEVEVGTATPASEITVKRLPARIGRCERVSHDVMRVELRLPLAESFDFQAGQYLDVLLPGGRRRSFSIASPPGSAPLLELHVRRVPGGEFTEQIFTRPAQGRLLDIQGPLGQFCYRETAAPMLLVGGGTGLAPLESMLRHVIGRGLSRRMHLYWGCRTREDVYADDRLRQLAEQGLLAGYVSVLSEAPPGWQGERGWVHEAVLRHHPDLAPFDVYAAGPPAMIDAIRREFPAQGARHLWFDSFDYAPDTLERQRNAASTRA